MEKYNYYEKITNEINNEFNNIYKTSYTINLVNQNDFKNKNIEEYNTLKRNINNSFCLEEIGGYYNPITKKIFIFYNNIEKINNNKNDSLYDNGLTYLLRIILHELEHRLQFDKDYNKNSFSELERFKIDLENIITHDIKEINFSYSKYHESMYTEIDADYKAIINSLKISKKLNEITKYGIINIDYYNNYKQYCQFRDKIYDMPFFVDYLNKYLKAKPKIFLRKLSGFFSDYTIYDFFNENGEYKRIEEIINNKKINNVNPFIRASLLCSKDCINKIYQDINITNNKEVLEYLIKHGKLLIKDFNNRKKYYVENINNINLQIFDYTKIINNKYNYKTILSKDIVNEEYYIWLNEKVKDWETYLINILNNNNKYTTK